MVRSRTAAALVGYFVGTLPSADLVAKLTGSSVDLREAGTGNPGAANAAQVLGARFGLVVMGADIAKGVLAGRAGARLGGPDGVHVGASAAVVGHCYPVWSGFRGGKGVATSVGQVLVAFPAYFPIDASVALATAALPWWRQRAFAATATAGATWVVASTIWWRRGWPNLWGPRPSVSLPVSAAISTAVIVHRFLTVATQSEEHPRPQEGS